MDVACSIHGRDEKCIKLCGKRGSRSEQKWEDAIKKDLKEIWISDSR